MNMRFDLIATLTTRLSPPLRALGYLDETLAMRRRARANHDAWQPHLENTRRFVLASAEKCRSRNKIVILGSGLLLDVPLAELAGMFREVVLADVVCLPEVSKCIKGHRNVRFIEYDVTGVAGPLYRNVRGGASALPEPAATIVEHGDADLIVSLNILSQLWVVPRAYAARHLRNIPSELVEDWCGQTVEAHYAALRALDCDVCLVGDHEYVKRDDKGDIISRGSTVYDLKLPEPDASWTWNIVPIGKDSPHASKELLVGGWHITP
jgi:hypothetical protein